MADPFLDPAQIRATTFIRHAEIHNELGSTNDRATELARDLNVKLPALVVARQQTAGRGRGENTWWSADGALTFSVLLEPAAFGIGTAIWPQLSLTTAVALCDALALEIPPRAGASPPPPQTSQLPTCTRPPSPIAIKWPNDVFLSNAKIAGILIESPGGPAPAKDRLVIGIGINVNNSWHSAPRGAVPNSIALCDFTTEQHDLQQALINLLNALQKRIEQLAASDPGLPTTWQQLSWLTKQNVDVAAGSSLVSGTCLGIDFDGALLVDDGATTHRVFSGTIRVV